MGHGVDISRGLRSACIVMRYHTRMTIPSIANELRLKEATVKDICYRAEKATGSNNLLKLLEYHAGAVRKPAGGPRQLSKARTGSIAADKEVPPTS
jgi:predicted transcriptional regulator